MCWSMFRLCTSKSLCNLFIIYSLFRGLGFIHMFPLQCLCEQPFKGKEIKLNVSLLVAYSEIFWNRPYRLTQSSSWRIHWLYNLMKVDSSLNNAVICLSIPMDELMENKRMDLLSKLSLSCCTVSFISIHIWGWRRRQRWSNSLIYATTSSMQYSAVSFV